ncbi:tyrosine-type recombinase/integrase [Gloeobacter kilaueensis]|uniref:Tyrosine recombinase XerD n=1 Tax=Gloeobacter kilaueensis (strain ATCC BAA-2537 / CCAP 1431/1 / ULC 316 / JS1) TaxID=1183438 RepID=U5QEV2_GLOK1|nr:tyrosine-type recombinase/integrase [Gloeobacter kilaueensis]AGY57378.1 tyrosine recombinase XerD [Gloeobacter kilaueensis JS1]
MELPEAIEHWLDNLIASGELASNTLRAYQGDLDDFVRFVESEKADWATLDAAAAQSFACALKQQHLSTASIARKLAALRSFYRHAGSQGWVAGDPAARIPTLSAALGRNLPRVLSVAEVTALIDGSPSPFERAVLELLYSAGLKANELCELQRGDLSFAEAYLCLKSSSGRERVVPLLDTTLEAVSRYLETLPAPRQPLFSTPQGRPLNRFALYRLVREAAVRAGIGWPVTPDTLRHSLAVHLLEGGADLATVQELLGHASIATTEIYSRLARNRAPLSAKDR